MLPLDGKRTSGRRRRNLTRATEPTRWPVRIDVHSAVDAAPSLLRQMLDRVDSPAAALRAEDRFGSSDRELHRSYTTQAGCHRATTRAAMS